MLLGFMPFLYGMGNATQAEKHFLRTEIENLCQLPGNTHLGVLGRMELAFLFSAEGNIEGAQDLYWKIMINGPDVEWRTIAQYNFAILAFEQMKKKLNEGIVNRSDAFCKAVTLWQAEDLLNNLLESDCSEQLREATNNALNAIKHWRKLGPAYFTRNSSLPEFPNLELVSPIRHVGFACKREEI